MTLRRSPEVWCDGDSVPGGCGGIFWYGGTLKQAKRAGWSRSKGKDYCDTCTKARAEQNARIPA